MQPYDKLTQENARLRVVIVDLVYAYQNHEGGWDRMEAPIAAAKQAALAPSCSHPWALVDEIGRPHCAACAAPDLLAALEVLLEEAEGFNVSGVYFNEPCMGHKGIGLARAAIDKAKSCPPSSAKQAEK